MITKANPQKLRRHAATATEAVNTAKCATPPESATTVRERDLKTVHDATEPEFAITARANQLLVPTTEIAAIAPTAPAKNAPTARWNVFIVTVRKCAYTARVLCNADTAMVW